MFIIDSIIIEGVEIILNVEDVLEKEKNKSEPLLPLSNCFGKIRTIKNYNVNNKKNNKPLLKTRCKASHHHTAKPIGRNDNPGYPNKAFHKNIAGLLDYGTLSEYIYGLQTLT